MSNVKRKVSYFYDPDIGTHYYGPNHPMKPHRITLTNNLILHYGLYNMMESYKPRPASAEDMTAFHSEEYINFLQSVTPENKEQHAKQMQIFNVGEDCPVFSRQFQYCQLYAGASVGGAVNLNYGMSDVVINWAGGLHHAKKSEASGFCYVNDIVLAILELLKYHARVLYIDIDIHHGDGVEEAFLTTDRVCTVSFHKFGGGFFPGTGDLTSSRSRERQHAINVPLKDGMTDSAYEMLFKPIMRRILEVYQPEAIVFQSGADSLAGDRLGAFNLSIKGHAECVQYMAAFRLPMLLLGGGGYNISSVARCWAYETARILGVELEDELPRNDHEALFRPGTKLHLPLPPDHAENLNTREYLDGLRRKIFASIDRMGSAGGVEFRERLSDAMRPEDMDDGWPSETPSSDDGGGGGGGGSIEERAAPPSQQRARLWDGRGHFDDVPSGSGRSRHDREYSLDLVTPTEEGSPTGAHTNGTAQKLPLQRIPSSRVQAAAAAAAASKHGQGGNAPGTALPRTQLPGKVAAGNARGNALVQEY